VKVVNSEEGVVSRHAAVTTLDFELLEVVAGLAASVAT